MSVGFALNKIDGAAVGFKVCWIDVRGLELIIVALYDGFVVDLSLGAKLGWLLRTAGVVVGLILENTKGLDSTVGGTVGLVSG